MSGPLIAAGLWVLGSALVAMLPLRAQYAPGIALLLAAPLLIGWIAAAHGALGAALALAAVGSMFRNPLVFLARRAWSGRVPEKRAPARDEGVR